MTAPSITITEPAPSDLLALSALRHCCTWTETRVTKNWDRLSSGEEILWAVLAHVNGVGDAPSLASIDAGLDTDNAALVRRVLNMAETPITCRCGHPVASHREVGCGAYAGHGRGCSCMKTPDSVRRAHNDGTQVSA